MESLARYFMLQGTAPADVGRLFATFTAYAPPFRDIVSELGVPGVTPPGTRTEPAGAASLASDQPGSR